MNHDEPEAILIDTQNDFPIITKPAYPDLKFLFQLFFIFLLYSIIGGLVTGALLLVINGSHNKSPLLQSFFNLLSYMLTLLLIIRYAVKKNQHDSTFNFSFNKIHNRIVPVIIISTLALVVGLERVSDLIPMPKSVQKFFEHLFSKDVFSILLLIVAAPVLEEILCRGIVLKGLLKKYSSYKAILISAIFFAAIHMNPWQALPAFFGGLFIGWVFYKTQSIIPGMIIHATINTSAALTIFFLPREQQDFLSLLGMPHYIILCLLSAVIFISGCVIIYKKIPKQFR